MDSQLKELEKAVSEAADYISRIKKTKRSPADKETIEKLKAENHRLDVQRKEAKRRIKAIIRKIDKIKWNP